MKTKEQRIASLQTELAAIKELLPYADGLAYSQDTRRILEIEQELFKLKQQQEAA